MLQKYEAINPRLGSESAGVDFFFQTADAVALSIGTASLRS